MKEKIKRNKYNMGSRSLAVYQMSSVDDRSNDLKVLLEKLFAYDQSDLNDIFQVKMYIAARKKGSKHVINITNKNVTPLRLQEMCGSESLGSITYKAPATCHRDQSELHVGDINKRASRNVAGLFLSMLLVTGETDQFIRHLDRIINDAYTKIADPVLRSCALIEIILTSLSFPITIPGSKISDRLSPPSFDKYLRLMEQYISEYIISYGNIELNDKGIQYYLDSTISNLIYFYINHHSACLLSFYKMCVRVLRSSLITRDVAYCILFEHLERVCSKYPGFDVICLSSGIVDLFRIHLHTAPYHFTERAKQSFARYLSEKPFGNKLSQVGYSNLFKLLKKSENRGLSRLMIEAECSAERKYHLSNQLEHIDTFVRLFRILDQSNSNIDPAFMHRGLNNPILRKTLQDNQIQNLDLQDINKLLLSPGKSQRTHLSI